MGQFVIVAYGPKPGKENQLRSLVAKHHPVLRAENLVTDRPAYVMRAANGTLVEIFEWQSTEAISRAHTNEKVQALWAEFEAVCDCLPLQGLAECQKPFAGFEPIDLAGLGDPC